MNRNKEFYIKTLGFFKTISYCSNFFELTKFIDSDGEITDERGFIIMNTMNSEITWDNLEYFKNFDNAKKTDCKMELKKLGVYKKGMMKDLVRLLEFANYK